MKVKSKKNGNCFHPKRYDIQVVPNVVEAIDVVLRKSCFYGEMYDFVVEAIELMFKNYELGEYFLASSLIFAA
jgi:hypothetical protein